MQLYHKPGLSNSFMLTRICQSVDIISEQASFSCLTRWWLAKLVKPAPCCWSTQTCSTILDSKNWNTKRQTQVLVGYELSLFHLVRRAWRQKYAPFFFSRFSLTSRKTNWAKEGLSIPSLVFSWLQVIPWINDGAWTMLLLTLTRSFLIEFQLSGQF